MLGNGIEQLHRLMHVVVWVHYPEDHRWMLPIFVVVLVIAPAWMGWHVLRLVLSISRRAWRARSARSEAAAARPVGIVATSNASCCGRLGPPRRSWLRSRSRRFP